MAIIRSRLLSLTPIQPKVSRLVLAEHLAFQVRKIIEGIAYAALSAAERKSSQLMTKQRTKDADKVLRWLATKNLLRLPSAQRLEPANSNQAKWALSHVAENDMTLNQL